MKLGNLGWNLLPPTGCPGLPGTAICLKNLNLNPGIRVCLTSGPRDCHPQQGPVGAASASATHARTHAHHTTPHHGARMVCILEVRVIVSFCIYSAMADGSKIFFSG
jgi:hypothetical protein